MRSIRMEFIFERINEIILQGGEKEAIARSSPREPTNLFNWGIEA